VIKLASRRAAIVLAASALTLAVGLLPAQAATAGWRIDTTLALRGEVSIFTDVAASSPADAWAIGLAAKTEGTSLPQTIISHWTGKAWRPVTLPAKIVREWARQGAASSVVGAASARNVWVFGGFPGDYLRLDGNRWSIGQLPGVSKKSGAVILIDAAKVFNGTDVWAFGARVSASGVATPYAAHYSGGNWSRVTVPDLPGGALMTAVAAVSSRDIWAVETSLSDLSSPPSAAVRSAAVRSAAVRSAVARSAVVASPAERMAVARLAVARLAVARRRAAASDSAAASQVVLHWTAKTRWQDAAKQPNLAATDQLVSAVAEPNGDVWFGGSANNTGNGSTPLTAEWNGSSWSVSDLPVRASSAEWQLIDMTPDGSGGIWALAQDSNSAAERIWHLHGASWSQVRPAFGKHPWALVALALVPRTRTVWAVGAVLIGKASKGTADGLIAVDGSLPR
jgi:hypothetical protein